jgi:nicotinamidase-related amidase
MPQGNGTALLFIDVINHFNFPGGDKLLKNALPVAPVLRALKRKARKAGVPTVYVNDNFGQWRSNISDAVETALSGGRDVRSFVQQLLPDRDDYVVLKPKHSAFYQTPLDLLLRYLGAQRLILTGLATNSCIISTAADAHMRDLSLAVPSDGCAAETARAHRHSLNLMVDALSADISLTKSLRLSE